MRLDFRIAGASDLLLLVSGAGDNDTGGGLCSFDGASIERIDRVSTAGMAVFDGHLARLLRVPFSTGGGELLVYDHRGVSHYLRVDELCDAHYLAWNGTHLVVTSTGTNSIAWLDLAGNIVRQWRAPGEDDSWHLNDLCLLDGRVYASAFGKGTHYRDYKDNLSNAAGFVFDCDSGQVAVSGLCTPHSPRSFDGAWTICESVRHAVVQIEMESGLKRREAKLNGFTRGMAVTEDYVIVGESAQRGEREAVTTGAIAILRRSDFDLVSRVEVPFSEVSDIVVVPRQMAEGVRTGFRTNALRVREADQLQLFRDIGREPKRLWAFSDSLPPSQRKIAIQAEFPASVVCGKTALIPCTATNHGDGFLCSELPYPVRLSYRWRSADDSPLDLGEPLRTDLPSTLAPGSSVSLRMEVLAPPSEGAYRLHLTSLQEGVAWFDSAGETNTCSAMVNVMRGTATEGSRQTSPVSGGMPTNGPNSF
jgi:acetolactate synthase-1/2/3 large subunit